MRRDGSLPLALLMATIISSSPADWLTALPLRAEKAPAASSLRLLNLDNQLVDPFNAAGEAKAIVFLFVSVECPISNRYAPEMRRLYRRFGPKGVRFWLVYPNPAETADMIRHHIHDYGFPRHALRDVTHDLVERAQATITPEAVVYDRLGRALYRGRLDDRYIKLGVERPHATRHDLRDALTAILLGKPIAQPRTPVVGCYIADFGHVH